MDTVQADSGASATTSTPTSSSTARPSLGAWANGPPRSPSPSSIGVGALTTLSSANTTDAPALEPLDDRLVIAEVDPKMREKFKSGFVSLCISRFGTPGIKEASPNRTHFMFAMATSEQARDLHGRAVNGIPLISPIVRREQQARERVERERRAAKPQLRLLGLPMGVSDDALITALCEQLGLEEPAVARDPFKVDGKPVPGAFTNNAKVLYVSAALPARRSVLVLDRHVVIIDKRLGDDIHHADAAKRAFADARRIRDEEAARERREAQERSQEASMETDVGPDQVPAAAPPSSNSTTRPKKTKQTKQSAACASAPAEQLLVSTSASMAGASNPANASTRRKRAPSPTSTSARDRSPSPSAVQRTTKPRTGLADDDMDAQEPGQDGDDVFEDAVNLVIPI